VMVGGIEISPQKIIIMFFQMLKYDTRLLNNDGNNKGVFMCGKQLLYIPNIGCTRTK